MTDDLELLLSYLTQARSFDFTAYKRSTLGRRVQKRMQMVGVESFSNYVDYLEVHPEEFAQLFNTILINVTSFFRDPSTWEWLRDVGIPRIIASKPAAPIRIWSAGCASGEEPYTVAILFADALGVDRFKDQVKIYATDLDEEALAQGRQASYGDREVAGVPPAALERYFDRVGDRHVFNKELRRSVIFGRHDLLQDAPISRVSLLVCRNTLMYFNADAQARILERFHFAVEDGGLLFLGKAEMLLARGGAFAPMDLKARIFERMPRGVRRERAPVEDETDTKENGPSPMNPQMRLEMLALESDPVAQIVVDLTGVVIVANLRARATFGIATADVGRRLQDLEISYRPVELRSLVEQACAERRQTGSREIEWTTPAGEAVVLDLTVVPLTQPTGELAGAKVVFRDITRFRRLQDELRGTHQELETTNEELQSTVEELETTNEELQSTNEELETMNEELQSTNEELSTANHQLRQRGDELNHLNNFLESILRGLDQAVVVVDKELRVKGWNRKAEDLWGLRADEVRDQHFLNLDIGLQVDQLRAPIRAVLAGEPQQSLMLDAITRRGRPVQLAIGCTALGNDRDVRGVILMMDSADEGSGRQEG